MRRLQGFRGVGAGALALLTIGILSSCGGGTTPSATPSRPSQSPWATPAPTPTAQPAVMETAPIYFVRDGKVGATARDLPHGYSASDAVSALLSATVTPADEAAQLHQYIPSGTTLLASSWSNGVLTVDLSTTFAGGGGGADLGTRLAQVVYTATGSTDTQRVRVLIGGKPATSYANTPAIYAGPVGRADLEPWTPAILVEAPAPGVTVTSPIHVYGTANVFEAQFHIGIMSPGGVIMVDQTVMATSGSGTRGTFDVTMPYPSSLKGSAIVVAWDVSMKDGSRIDEVQIPLQLS